MKCTVLFVLLLFVAVVATAQDDDMRKTDWRLRIGGTLEYELTKDWSMDVSWESRFKDNISEYDESLAEIASTYKSPWDIKVHGIFRHYIIPKKNNKYRYTFGASYDKFIGDSDLEWAIRARWQRENHYGGDANDFETLWRFKFSLVYEVNSYLVLVLEDELFYEMGNEDRWDKNRITAGVEVELTDELELSAFYRFENELSRKVSDFDYTLGFYFKYEIEGKKDKKNKEKPKHFGHPYRW